MLDRPDLTDSLRTAFAHGVPLLLLSGAALAGRTAIAPADSWQVAKSAATTALVPGALAMALLAASAFVGESASPSIVASTVVVSLIAFLGFVVTRYSATYLRGEVHQQRFARHLLATAGFAALVAATDHMLVVCAAWLLTSTSLQRLLTFYDGRRAARSAAREKFVVSRAADLCIAAATILLHERFGTFSIEEMFARSVDAHALGVQGHVAAVLIAAAVLLKTAQLPFHGWLLHVMEAPTAVSALLHAGVVNLGGLLLVRLSTVVTGSAAAQSLLVLAGASTAGLAALVATTRVSVKVALAWSTCAQMGFMVLQCGLGLHGAALLHLVAHSLYKAHAFLRAGSTVQNTIAVGMVPSLPPPGFAARGLAALFAATVLVAFASMTGASIAEQPGLAAAIGVAALAFARPLADGGLRTALPYLAAALVWCVLHRLANAALAAPERAGVHDALLAVVAFAVFAVLQAVRTAVELHPDGAVARRLHAFCYGGFYLGEWFTRLVLRAWPERRTAVVETQDPRTESR